MPKQTFPTYADACGWNAMLPKRAPRPALGHDLVVDTAIVGAGYTGLSAAYRLAELRPSDRVAVFEALTVGEGSSGRNSGFTSRNVLPRSAASGSADKAKAQTELLSEPFDWLLAQISDQKIACDLSKTGSIRGAATADGEASLRTVLEVAKANKLTHEVLDRQGVAERIGSSYYRFGLFLPDTYLLQPAALIRGLADALPPSVTLYEQTGVQGLKKTAAGWELRTPGGKVTAKNVVLATNSHIARLGYLGSRVAPIFTYAAVTKPISDTDLPNLGAAERWGLLPSHRLGTTLRRIGHDRLMVRSLYAHNAELPPQKVRKNLRERFERRWPNLAHVEFDYVWGGNTGWTMNGAPYWGKFDDGLYAAGGCNGSGIAKCTMLGRRLADLINGTGNQNIVPDIMGKPDWIAPEPFRSLGYIVISTIERRKAGIEA